MHTHQHAIRASKSLGVRQNVSLNVIDNDTGNIVQTHEGHNSATNSMILGIAYFLTSSIWATESHSSVRTSPTKSSLDQTVISMLSSYTPRYISLGTAGLMTQRQDESGLPIVGDPLGPEYDDVAGDLADKVDAALKELEAILAELGKYQCLLNCECCKMCDCCSDFVKDLLARYEEAKKKYEDVYLEYCHALDEFLCKQYMNMRPGYGADGYDFYKNNGRTFFGLGTPYSIYSVNDTYITGNTVTYKGAVYECTSDTPDPAGAFNSSHWNLVSDNKGIAEAGCNIELISATFPRQDISYRDVVPEYESEIPETIDVVLSCLISTGALKQFRPEGQDYMFITEAGLWSKKTWSNSGENGLLAGYRIVPPNESNWDMSIKENRDILKKNVLKVGINQCVQVVWKIQIGAIDDLYTTTINA